MKIKPIVEHVILSIEDKIEQGMIAGIKKATRNHHGDKSYIGVFGVGRTKEGYYIRGPWQTFIPDTVENPGVFARHFVKNALAPVVGPMPPDKGVPHKIILVPFPSFIIKTPLSEQKKFFHDWEAMVESFNLPWCELVGWR